MNESQHYSQAEKWLKQAEAMYEREGANLDVDTFLRFANVHAQLAIAADVDREATAGQRIAECVPEGGSRLQVAMPR